MLSRTDRTARNIEFAVGMGIVLAVLGVLAWLVYAGVKLLL
jgi:Na+-transporting methylmalonyl-CoA/oxaloacetate decarboxylase gamma subunit